MSVKHLAGEPCLFCGHNRWRTLEDGKAYQCRQCGDIRGRTEKRHEVKVARAYDLPPEQGAVAEPPPVLTQSQSVVSHRNWLQKLLHR